MFGNEDDPVYKINREALFSSNAWDLANRQLVNTLTACIIAAEIECDKMLKKYLHEYINIDVYIPPLLNWSMIGDQFCRTYVMFLF